MNTIMSLCEDNHGLGICPEGIVNTSNSKTIVEVPFDEDDFEWDIYLTTKKRVQLSYPAKLMKQFLTPRPAPAGAGPPQVTGIGAHKRTKPQPGAAVAVLKRGTGGIIAPA